MLRAVPLALLIGWSPTEGSLLDMLMGGKRLSDEQRCVEYGFKPGTDAYANCRLQLDLARKNGMTTCRVNGDFLRCF